MTTTRIQSDYADLREQLVVMLILAVAIALRSMFVGGDDSPHSRLDFPNATEVQHDATRQERPSWEELRSIATESGTNFDNSSRHLRIIREMKG